MTEHAAGCGHNHDPNPYTDPARANAYSRVIRNLFRLSTINVVLDPRMCTAYAAATVIGLSDPTDRVPTFRAMLWEIGSLVNIMTGGKEPELATGTIDDEPEPDDDETHFGTQAMKAFFAAASVGDLEAAVRVSEAVRGEAARTDIDEDAFLAQFFGNIIVSIAYTARTALNDNQLRLFEE